MTTAKIPLSKTKTFLMLLGSIIFVVIGILGMINPAKYVSAVFRSPVIIFISGLAGVLFFGYIVFLILKKLFKGGTGLIINDEGINDNSGGSSAGMIFWKDIEKIDVLNVLNQKFIRIIVKNPDEYIERQTSLITKKIMAANYKKYGSPLQISANTLNIKFDELYELLRHNLIENRFY